MTTLLRAGRLETDGETAACAGIRKPCIAPSAATPPRNARRRMLISLAILSSPRLRRGSPFASSVARPRLTESPTPRAVCSTDSDVVGLQWGLYCPPFGPGSVPPPQLPQHFVFRVAMHPPQLHVREREGVALGLPRQIQQPDQHERSRCVGSLGSLLHPPYRHHREVIGGLARA